MLLFHVAAYFYVGTSGSPRTGSGAIRLRDERGGSSPLRKYNGEAITLSLPDGKTLRDYRWFSVYCDEYEVSTQHMTTVYGSDKGMNTQMFVFARQLK